MPIRQAQQAHLQLHFLAGRAARPQQQTLQVHALGRGPRGVGEVAQGQAVVAVAGGDGVGRAELVRQREITPEELVDAVRQLVKSDVPAPVLDLDDVSYVPSYHMPGIREAAQEAMNNGRSLTVRGRRNVITVLERMGFAALARLKTAD